MIKSKDKFHELNMYLKDLDSNRHRYTLSLNGIKRVKEQDFGTEELFIQPTQELPEKITAKEILDKIKQEKLEKIRLRELAKNKAASTKKHGFSISHFYF